MKKVRTYQYVDGEIKYTEDYTIGDGGDFSTIQDLRNELDELIGVAIDLYDIEEI